MKYVVEVAALGLVLAGCATGPAPRIFVLAAAASASGTAAGGRAMQLQAVQVPDYLDSTDILVRTGAHEVKASETGRWGERLSQGVTRALLEDLAMRLPGARVTLSPPADPEVPQIVVSVDAFDTWPDGHCVLAARWTVLRRAGDAGGRTGRGVFVGPAGSGDAGRVAGMADAIDRLAGEVEGRPSFLKKRSKKLLSVLREPNG